MSKIDIQEAVVDKYIDLIKKLGTLNGEEHAMLGNVIKEGRKEARKQAINDCIECVRELDHGSFLDEPVLNKDTVLSKLKELE